MFFGTIFLLLYAIAPQLTTSTNTDQLPSSRINFVFTDPSITFINLTGLPLSYLIDENIPSITDRNLGVTGGSLWITNFSVSLNRSRLSFTSTNITFAVDSQRNSEAIFQLERDSRLSFKVPLYILSFHYRNKKGTL